MENSPLSSVRDRYNRWAAAYDHDSNFMIALEEPCMKEAVGDVRNLTVLDLGCGTGRHTLWLAAAGAQVTAVDFSEGMLAEARRKAGKAAIRFVAHGIHDGVPFGRAQFDVVVSGLVLEHIRNLKSFFDEAYRVLRPGGRFVISAMHPAMFLRGKQASFTDPESGEKVMPGSVDHKVGDIVMAALTARFTIENIQEHTPDSDFAARFPHAEKYIGWPMVILFKMRADG